MAQFGHNNNSSSTMTTTTAAASNANNDASGMNATGHQVRQEHEKTFIFSSRALFYFIFILFFSFV
jgi:hypothetical protein